MKTTTTKNTFVPQDHSSVTLQVVNEQVIVTTVTAFNDKETGELRNSFKTFKFNEGISTEAVQEYIDSNKNLDFLAYNIQQDLVAGEMCIEVSKKKAISRMMEEMK